jgi:hypothetical protein
VIDYMYTGVGQIAKHAYYTTDVPPPIISAPNSYKKGLTHSKGRGVIDTL